MLEKKEEKKPEEKTDLKSEIKRAGEASENPPEVKPEEKLKEGEKKEDFKPKYPHLWTGDIKSYNQRLEEAYNASSTEGQKLNDQLTKSEKEKEIIAQIVQSDPELKNKFAEKLYDGGYKEPILDESGNLNKGALGEVVRMVLREELPAALQKNPALKTITGDKEQKDREVLEQFGEAHPEIQTNPELQENLDLAFGVVAQKAAKKGQSLEMKDLLNKAWELISGEKSEDLKEKTRSLQKENASMSSSSSEAPKTSSSKTELTPAEKGIAEKLGLSDKAYLEGKNL